MFNFDIIYLGLNLILLVSFIVCGKRMSNGEKFTLNALLCIVVYSIVLGLRYNRGYDYFHYINHYLYGYTEGKQYVYVLLLNVMKVLGIGKHYIFVIYSLIEMLCAFLFLKRYKKYGTYIVPFFLLSTIVFNEYAIRQALGFSFAFLCIDSFFDILGQKQLLNKESIVRLVKIVVLFAISYSIHSVCGFVLIIIFLIAIFLRNTVPIIVSVPSLIFSVFFFQQWIDYSWFEKIISLFSSDERLSHYVNEYDQWFTNDASNDRFTRNSIVMVFELLGSISLFYFANKTIQEKYTYKKDFICLYNVFVIGVIFLNCFRNIELFQRIAQNIYLFYFFAISLVLYHRTEIIKSSREKILGVFLVWWVYDYVKYLFFRGEMTQFIWDI